MATAFDRVRGTRVDEGQQGANCEAPNAAEVHVGAEQERRMKMQEGATACGWKEDPRQAFRAAVLQEREQCEAKRRPGIMDERVEFALADYDPKFMTIFLTTIAIGYGYYGFATMRNLPGDSEVLRKEHFIAFYVQSFIAAVSALLLSVTGPHTAYIARYYQAMAAVLIATLFSLNLTQRSFAEFRRAASPNQWSPFVNMTITSRFPVRISCTDSDPWATGQINDKFASESRSCESRFLSGPSFGVQMSYFAAIVPARLYPETALALVVYELLATIFAVSVNGVLFRGGARIIVFFLCMGCTAIAMSRTRKLNAYAKWREARHLSRILDKHRSFLYTLVPRRVYDEQSLLQSMADLTPHTGSLNGHNSSIRSFSSLSSSIPDPAGPRLLPSKTIRDVVVMFCSLPDLEMLRTDSSDSERFAYLDRIFSLFDQLLGEFNVYKYHHIKHSYVVVSSAAALEPRASSLRTELCNFLILAEFLNAIVKENLPPDSDQRLSLRCGISVGDLTGAIIGANKRFYCLFGNAMNMSARMCQQAPALGGVAFSKEVLAIMSQQDPTQDTSTPDVSSSTRGGPQGHVSSNTQACADESDPDRSRCGTDRHVQAGAGGENGGEEGIQSGTSELTAHCCGSSRASLHASMPGDVRAAAAGEDGDVEQAQARASRQAGSEVVMSPLDVCSEVVSREFHRLFSDSMQSVRSGHPLSGSVKFNIGGVGVTFQISGLGEQKVKGIGMRSVFVLNSTSNLSSSGQLGYSGIGSGSSALVSAGVLSDRQQKARAPQTDDVKSWRRQLKAGSGVAFGALQYAGVMAEQGRGSENERSAQLSRLKWSRFSLDFVDKDVQAAYLMDSAASTLRNLCFGYFSMTVIFVVDLWSVMELDRLQADHPTARTGLRIALGLYCSLISLSILALAAATCLHFKESPSAPGDGFLGLGTLFGSFGFGGSGRGLAASLRAKIAPAQEGLEQQRHCEQLPPLIVQGEAAPRIGRGQGAQEAQGGDGQAMQQGGKREERLWWQVRAFVAVLLLIKVAYVLGSVVLFLITNADGWFLTFTMYAIANHAFGNGIRAKTNGILIAVVMLVGTAVVIRNMGFAASPRILVNLVVSLMGIFASRSEQHLAQSRWRIEKLVATELEHVRRTLEDLIPREMIEATVSAISGGQRASPREHTASLSKSRATKRAVLLCMDLCEYTVFVSSMPSEKVAVHIHNLFSSFDLILLGPDAASNGLFKMDTIGDEYIAAAWLDDVDAPGAKERNARVCQCMQAVADSMIQALEAYNQEQQIQLQCRMGMDAGPVIAGMQGILQPRFHLLGPPVEGSAKLQTEAENNRIKISDVVRSML